MKLAVALSITILFAGTTAHSQTFKVDSSYLSKKAFTVFTNRAFGQIATGQNTATLANFGALDVANGAVAFNAFAPLNFKGDTAKYVPLLSLELKGDLASDNVVSLFSNSKLNSNIDATIKLHFPIKKLLKIPLFKIGYYGTHYTKLYEKKLRLEKEYRLKLQLADTIFQNVSRDTLDLKWQIGLLSDQLSKERDTLKILEKSIDSLLKLNKPDAAVVVKLTKSYAETRTQMDKLFRDSLGIKLKKDSIEVNTNADPVLRRDDWRHIRKGLVDAFNDTLLRLELASPITRIHLFWVSVAGTFNQKKYWFYNEQLSFEDRITRVPYSRFFVGGELNYYSQNIRTRHAHYITFGFRRRGDNNILDLTTSTVNQKTKSSSGTTEREVVKSYSAYTDVVREYKSSTIFANYYLMFKYNALSAIHFFPEVDARKYLDGESEKKTYKNFGIGYVISVKDSKKDKSFLNFEAFYKFLDMGNQDESDKGFLERNEIGIRVGFPLNFVIN
jgi:hypothetical protein